jgi:hypothetical protein
MNGWYCPQGLDLAILNKETNEKILTALRDAYPKGLTAHEIAEQTDLPLKTIYSQTTELYREYYIFDERDITKPKVRGRPPTHVVNNGGSNRHRAVMYIENANNLFDTYEGKKGVPLPPGNVEFPVDLKDTLNKFVTKEDEEKIMYPLFDFLEITLRRMTESSDQNVKDWSPQQESDYCCALCGVNHEARDFIRATLTYLIDRLETSSRYIEFLKKINLFLKKHMNA